MSEVDRDTTNVLVACYLWQKLRNRWNAVGVASIACLLSDCFWTVWTSTSKAETSDWWNVTGHSDERIQPVGGSHHARFPHPTKLTSMVLSNDPTLFLRPRLPVIQWERGRVKILTHISLKTQHLVSSVHSSTQGDKYHRSNCCSRYVYLCLALAQLAMQLKQHLWLTRASMMTTWGGVSVGVC